MAVTLPAARAVNLSSLLRALTAGRKTNAGLAKQARASAAADTGAVVGQYRALQQQDQAAAAARQAEINRAASAAAKYVQGLDLGGRLATSYQQAAADQAGFGAGLSGQLRDTVGAETGKVQAALSTLGLAPVKDTTEAAGNAVYGVGGLLPANALAAAAPAAVAAANQTPANLVSYGQQEGIGALNAGKQQAAALEPDIAAALGKLPSLTQSYLSQYTTAADRESKQAFDEAASAIKLQQAGDKAAADTAYRQATLDSKAADRKATQEYRTSQLKALTAYRNGELTLSDARNQIAAANQKLAAQRAATAAAQGAARIEIARTTANNNATLGQERVDVAQQNANTSRYRATHPTSSKTKHYARVADKTGQYIVNEDTHAKYRVAGPKPSSSTTTAGPGGIKKPTASQIGNMVQSWKEGKPTSVNVPQTTDGGPLAQDESNAIRDVNGAIVYRSETGSTGKLKFVQAYKRLRAMGIGDKQSRAYLDTAYKRGEQGRAWLSNEEQFALRRAGESTKARIVNGHPIISLRQLNVLKKTGHVPPGQLGQGFYVIAQTF